MRPRYMGAHGSLTMKPTKLFGSTPGAQYLWIGMGFLKGFLVYRHDIQLFGKYINLHLPKIGCSFLFLIVRISANICEIKFQNIIVLARPFPAER